MGHTAPQETPCHGVLFVKSFSLAMNHGDNTPRGRVHRLALLLEEGVYRVLRVPAFVLLRLFRRHAGRRGR